MLASSFKSWCMIYGLSFDLWSMVKVLVYGPSLSLWSKSWSLVQGLVYGPSLGLWTFFYLEAQGKSAISVAITNENRLTEDGRLQCETVFFVVGCTVLASLNTSENRLTNFKQARISISQQTTMKLLYSPDFQGR